MFKKYVMNVVKAAAVMFTVGVVLAYAAPIIASFSGISLTGSATLTSPLWTGLYFGAFGAISAVATPIVNKVVDSISARFFKKTLSDGVSTELKISTGPAVMSEAKDLGIGTGTHYQDLIAAKKAAAASLFHTGP